MTGLHPPETPAFEVGDVATALVDLTTDGFGIVRCADKVDRLVVRSGSFDWRTCICVVHEAATWRSFGVAQREMQKVSAIAHAAPLAQPAEAR